MLLLGGALLTAVAWSAPQAAEQPKGAPAKDAASTNFVGSETCAGCHEEVAKGFAKNPHTKAGAMHNGVSITCENGHGAGKEAFAGPIGHEDYSRVLGLGATLSPNEHYGLDVYYAYSQVYTSTNICYDAVNTSYTNMPGASTVTGAACSAPASHGSTTAFTLLATDSQKAPTQFGSMALTASPVKSLHAALGYRASSVSATRLFEDARDVNGSGVSLYQSPFVNLAWTVRPGLIWKADYNYYGYGEGQGGAQYCTLANPTTATGTATVVPCNSLAWTSAYEGAAGATAPRTYHANNLTLGIHYEF